MKLIMTKINVAKTITEIASEGKSPPCEMINSVTKLLNIAIVNPQYKSRPLVAPFRWRRSRSAAMFIISDIFLSLVVATAIEKDWSVSVKYYATKDNINMTRGEKIWAFIEHYCQIQEGAQVGQPIKLMKFQGKFILDMFDNPHG